MASHCGLVKRPMETNSYIGVAPSTFTCPGDITGVQRWFYSVVFFLGRFPPKDVLYDFPRHPLPNPSAVVDSLLNNFNCRLKGVSHLTRHFIAFMATSKLIQDSNHPEKCITPKFHYNSYLNYISENALKVSGPKLVP